jgi:hypothetical protein
MVVWTVPNFFSWAKGMRAPKSYLCVLWSYGHSHTPHGVNGKALMRLRAKCCCLLHCTMHHHADCCQQHIGIPLCYLSSIGELRTTMPSNLSVRKGTKPWFRSCMSEATVLIAVAMSLIVLAVVATCD